MSKRKGVSAEEKRSRMLQLFYEKKDVFQLKELEKIAPKEKGIVVQSVKEVVQSLVDDGLIDTDKIGTSVYFWAFPSKAANIRRTKVEEMNEKLSSCRKKRKTLEPQVEAAKQGREESDERTRLLQTLTEKERELSDLKLELQKYKDSDPEVLEKLKSQIEVAKDSANRWTDNVYALKSWCQKKFFVESSILDKQFGIPEEFDYVE